MQQNDNCFATVSQMGTIFDNILHKIYLEFKSTKNSMLDTELEKNYKVLFLLQ